MRTSVPLPQAYRLLNHGPTVLVSAAHAGQSNAMAAAWAMPLDFDPPKVAVVLDRSTRTRELVEASGSFVLSVPCSDQAALVVALGTRTGKTLPDKLSALAVPWVPATKTEAPLIDGCVAWLECVVLPEPAVQQRHDLFLGEVVAAWADDRVFSGGRWHFDSAPDGLRTLHHVAGGQFFAIGAPVDGRAQAPSTAAGPLA
jgi:flavin reductase (DIM6/NTAB) family NADH-FMN oxidoreductase RutF